MFSLKERYREKKIVTAHRGFSGQYPENTMIAFREAVKLGVDIVEFDVRDTADGVPVIMHDATLDRTTDGHGKVGEWRYADLARLNASFWQGTHDRGSRRVQPQYEHLPVPRLQDVLEYLHDQEEIGINIQVYTANPATREEVCRLYRHHRLQQRAFLMIGTFAEAAEIRHHAPDIALCVGEDRGNLSRHRDFGVDYIQPGRDLVTPEFCREIARLQLPANMFYANTEADNRHYLACGIQGIMSDRPDLLLRNLAERN